MKEFNTRIKSKHDTTAHWDEAVGFIPLAGEIIIYDDYATEANGDIIPNIKIGTGNAYVQDLPFVDEHMRNTILAHINNINAHVSAADREFWNNKINIDDADDVLYGILSEETLTIIRN